MLKRICKIKIHKVIAFVLASVLVVQSIQGAIVSAFAESEGDSSGLDIITIEGTVKTEKVVSEEVPGEEVPGEEVPEEEVPGEEVPEEEVPEEEVQIYEGVEGAQVILYKVYNDEETGEIQKKKVQTYTTGDDGRYVFSDEDKTEKFDITQKYVIKVEVDNYFDCEIDVEFRASNDIILLPVGSNKLEYEKSVVNCVYDGGGVENNLNNAIGKNLIYESSDSDIIAVNEYGELEIKKATDENGIVITVRNTEDPNEDYAEYTIIVSKANRNIGLEDSYNVVVGGGEQPNFAAILSQGDTNIDGVNFYIEDEDNEIVHIDENNNFVFTGNEGEVVVIATKPTDDCYNEAVESFRIVVRKGSSLYKVSPSVNGWYNGNIVIEALGDKYLSKTVDGDLTEQIIISDLNDGKNFSYDFYVVTSDGKFPCRIDGINVDKTAPSGQIKLKTQDDTSIVEVWDGKIDIIDQEKIIEHRARVTIDGYDTTDGSGISEIYYYIGYNHTSVVEDIANSQFGWSEYPGNNKVKIERDKVCVVYAKIKDKAGNISYIHTDVIVTDTSIPNVIPTLEVINDGKQNKKYVTDSVKIKFNIENEKSGIHSIKYQIDVDGTKCEVRDLKTFEYPEKYSDITCNFTSTDEDEDTYIFIDKQIYNKKNVQIIYFVEDNAGNIYTQNSQRFMIYSDDPYVTFSEVVRNPEEILYFTENKEINVYIYDADLYNNLSIIVEAIDGEENEINNENNAAWEEREGLSYDEDNARYVKVIALNANGKYRINVEYKNKNDKIVTGSSNQIIIDKEPPTGNVEIKRTKIGQLLYVLSFGIFGNDSVEASIISDKDISGIKEVSYYLSSEFIDIDSYNMETLSWGEYTDPIPVNADHKYYIYGRLVDNAGNIGYVTTEENKVVIIEHNEGIISIEPYNSEKQVNGYYCDDIKVNLSIDDAYSEELNQVVLSSGISKIEYWITKDDIETFRNTKEFTDEIVTSFSEDIIIDASINDSKNVVLHVKVIDNAGMEYADEMPFSISAVPPTVEISYDNNKVINDNYYDDVRKATIIVTDREDTFVEENVTISISAVDSRNNNIEINRDEQIIWEEIEEGSGKYKTTISFDDSANYTLTVKYTNKAGVAAEEKMNVFTVDKTYPTGRIIVLEDAFSDFKARKFDKFNKDMLNIVIEGDDDISPIKISYIVKGDILSDEELENVSAYEWKEYRFPLIHSEENKYIVYAKVEDKAGHIIYLNSEGYIIDKTAPKITLSSEESEIKHNGVNVYNDDVLISVNVLDMPIDACSGIKSVTYTVKCDGVETRSGTLFTHSDEEDKIAYSKEFEIPIIAKENDSCDVVVYVTATDMLDNKDEEEIYLDIDVTKPIVSLRYSDNTNYVKDNNIIYYYKGRTADVTIIERPEHFDVDKAMKAIEITAKAANEADAVAVNPMAGQSWESDGDTHKLKLDFIKSANYSIQINYADMAGNDAGTVDTTGQVAPYKFTVDVTPPKASIAVGNLGKWEKLLETVSFGLLTKNTHKVIIEASDTTTFVKGVYYYKSLENKVMTVEELKTIADWKKANSFELDKDEQCVIYAKVVDAADNVTFVCSDGVLVDKTSPVFVKLEAAIAISPQQPINGIYTKDVLVDVKVEDVINGGTYSGIKSIRYEVYNMGNKTQEGILYDKSTVTSRGIQVWEDDGAIVVDKDLNNSNDVKVTVYVVDKVGHETSKTIDLKIDKTAPTIDIAYNNNTADTSYNNETLFKDNRVATIRVTERNFNPDKVVIDVTNTDGVKPVLSSWTVSKRGTGNGDDTEYMATLTYSADGDYKFDIKYTDEAGNVCTDIDYNQSLAPTQFTIDKTLPVVQVSYDNNSASNGNYYDQNRVATITVTEHNFDSSRFTPILTVTVDGKQSQMEVTGQWTSNGDVHRINVPFVEDGYYTIDMDYVDKAGNVAADMAMQSFYIDKTNPEMKITGILDNSANTAETIGLVITVEDVNIDSFKPKVYGIVYENGSCHTKDVDLVIEPIKNGYKAIVSNIETDGMYKVVCNASDKAGNVFSRVILDKAQGSTYVEERGNGQELLTFSVNREGSTYVLDQNLLELRKTYQLTVDKDLMISEFNADRLLMDSISISITRDGAPINEVIVDKKAIEDGNSWYRYDYVISKDNFKQDGIYVITVSSQDEAGNYSGNIVDDNYNVYFYVDTTKPDVIKMTNLDKNTFNEVSHVVDYEVFDAIGLSEIKIYLNGNVIQTITKEQLGDNITSYAGSFAIEESAKKQHIRIEVIDIAGNVIDSDNAVDVKSGKIVSFEKDITVSTNPLVRWYSNTALFYGSIAGAMAAIGGTIGLIAFKRKRRLR